jgi:hypothetical protein
LRDDQYGKSSDKQGTRNDQFNDFGLYGKGGMTLGSGWTKNTGFILSSQDRFHRIASTNTVVVEL